MHEFSVYPDFSSNPGSYCKDLSQEDSVRIENLGGDVGAVGRRGPRLLSVMFNAEGKADGDCPGFSWEKNTDMF